MAAARLADLQRGANQHSEGLPLGAASKLMNVSVRSAARAREVLLHGDSEVVAAVEYYAINGEALDQTNSRWWLSSGSSCAMVTRGPFASRQSHP